MPDGFFKKIASFIPTDLITRNEYLKDHTTLKVGGPADYFISAQTEEQVICSLDSARETNTPLFVLGNGSNILALDGGFRGVVLYIGKPLSELKAIGTTLMAQAGVSLTVLARFAASLGLSGLEFACGIPGTVGGGVVMNAGAYGEELGAQVSSVCVYTGSEVKKLFRNEMCFGYRSSIVQQKEWILLSVEFVLKPDCPETISTRMKEFSSIRLEKQPLQYPSAGSFFKRPANHFAGLLIDHAGLKGCQIGGAKVSELHAGFLINTGEAKAEDFTILMHHIQNTVFSHSGVWLIPEVHIMGQERE